MTGNEPRTLVVNFGDPERNPNGSGEQMLRSMFGQHRSFGVSRLSLSARRAPGSVDWLDTTADLLPSPQQPFPGAFKLPFVGSWIDRRAESLAPKVAANAAFLETNITWLVLNDPSVIYLGEQLVKRGHANRLVVSVWDTPEWLSHQRSLSKPRRERLLAAFDRVLADADRVFTISGAMTKRLTSAPGVASTPMYAAPPAGCAHEPGGARSTPSIVFAGSLYASGEWKTLLDAVEVSNRDNADDPIAVTCIGSLSRRTPKRTWVNYLDPQPPAIASERVNQGSVGYLPYPRSRSERAMVATTFPSKLAFYVAAGVPVLFHGPRSSAAARFVAAHDIGRVCDTDEPAALIAAARFLSADESFRAAFAATRHQLLAAEFSADTPAQKVQRVVDQLG